MGAGEANISSFFLKAGMDAALARSLSKNYFVTRGKTVSSPSQMLFYSTFSHLKCQEREHTSTLHSHCCAHDTIPLLNTDQQTH